MSDREIRDRITSLEAAMAKHKAWLKEIADVGCEHAEATLALEVTAKELAEALRCLAQGSLALIERVKRLEERLGMEA